jgi:hypothetical protein
VAAWREGDAPGFALWLAGQGPQLDRDTAILEYVRQRGAVEPRTIGQWISTLPAGPARDRARDALVEGLLATAPREAANYLRSLPRSDVPDDLAERTLRRLFATDPAAAERWLEESGWPDARKLELRAEFRR